MDGLFSGRLFSFKLGGKDSAALPHEKEVVKQADRTVTTYRFGGLKVTSVLSEYGDFGAAEWVNYFENEGDVNTEIISDLFDCDVVLPLPEEKAREWTTFFPDVKTSTRLYAPVGSTWDTKEFYCDLDKISNNVYPNCLGVGEKREFRTSGGRSSEAQAPFFRVHKIDRGYYFAVGWTGQWTAAAERTESGIKFRSGVQDANFYLKPGEKVRTSSVVVMPYEGSETEGANKWRRLVKTHFSLIGQPGRDQYGPLCAGIWGGMKTSSVLERIDCIAKSGLPYDYIWMDAGWYGDGTSPTPDEFEGDWYMHVGDWRVSKDIHPKGLKDVSEAVHAAGKKFLLWFEPERAIEGTPVTREHPEYFLVGPDKNDLNRLLNLGNAEAWQYCFDTLCGVIGAVGVDCYRQDFNMSPLEFWRGADERDRRGLTEIKHINGLYALWDALLEKFPHLIIDNCASGGRRIDIETLRRSIPLWRSDFQCPAYPQTRGTQCHNVAFNSLMPYSGTGCGRMVSEYSIRSAYSPAMTTNFFYSERDDKFAEPERLAVIEKYMREFLSVREYLSEDFYPLTGISDDEKAWCAYAFDRPEKGDGVLMAFRREESPYECAKFELDFLNGDYVFVDSDGKAFDFSCTPQNCGLSVLIFQKGKSKLFFYKKK